MYQEQEYSEKQNYNVAKSIIGIIAIIVLIFLFFKYNEKPQYIDEYPNINSGNEVIEENEPEIKEPEVVEETPKVTKKKIINKENSSKRDPMLNNMVGNKNENKVKEEEKETPTPTPTPVKPTPKPEEKPEPKPTPAITKLTAPKMILNPKNADEEFYNFRLKNFAPSTEELINKTFGKTLKFENTSSWEHNSYNSHAVGFATNLPSISVVEYGETSEYGQTTKQSDSYYYQHLHYLTDLKENTTYHYRIKIQDYNGNVKVSKDFTFKTKEITKEIIRIPDDFDSAPYTLTKSNAKYVLTQDLNVATLAINIKANDIEIDLNGFTITYDNEKPKVTGSSWSDYAYNEEASFGIRAGLWNYKNVKVFNGTIKQGKNGGAGFIGVGFNPLFLNHMGSGSYNEVAGVTVDYYGDSVSGIQAGNSFTHHNVIYDRGTVVDNRHQGIKALIIGSDKNNVISYNSIRRFRHQGIMGSGYKHHNEIYSDSFDTNSFLIGLGEGGKAEDNKMFAMGYNPVGTNWASNTKIKDNFIYMHCTAPTLRSSEYARKSGVAGTRYTLYGGNDDTYTNSLYDGNTIVLKAWDDCSNARGIWHATGTGSSGAVYKNNTVKVEAIEEYSKLGHFDSAVTAVDINGSNIDENGKVPSPTLFLDNTLIGNVNLITFGSSYGIGSSSHFYRTTLQKIDSNSTYFKPIRLGYWYWNTQNNRLIDTKVSNGIDLTKEPHFLGSSGLMEVSIGNSHTAKFVDQSGNAIKNKTIVAMIDSEREEIIKTNESGIATFDVLTIQHKKKGTVLNTKYDYYEFTLEGYESHLVNVNELKTTKTIVLTKIK